VVGPCPHVPTAHLTPTRPAKDAVGDRREDDGMASPRREGPANANSRGEVNPGEGLTLAARHGIGACQADDASHSLIADASALRLFRCWVDTRHDVGIVRRPSLVSCADVRFAAQACSHT